MKYKEIIKGLFIVSIFLYSCSNTHRSREQEKKALQLLGNSISGETSSLRCGDVKGSLQALFQTKNMIEELLGDKNIAENLFETVHKINDSVKNCEKLEVTLGTEFHPSIDKIKQILGKEDTQEKKEFSSSPTEISTYRMSVILYKYGWLSFGVTNNKVILISINFKKSGL